LLESDRQFQRLQLAVEILEQKFKSKFFKKKPEDLGDVVEEKEIEKSISPDGLDELRNLK